MKKLIIDIADNAEHDSDDTSDESQGIEDIKADRLIILINDAIDLAKELRGIKDEK